MSIKLYVGNFPQETSESDLRTLFEASGEVASVTVIRDRATGQARGYAFVEMLDVDGARKAISELDKHQYGGRSLAVNEAKPMHPRGLFDRSVRQRSSNGDTPKVELRTEPEHEPRTRKCEHQVLGSSPPAS